MSPLPKRSGANRKYTNADLPSGSTNNNTWRKKIIPTYIQYLASRDVKETWTIDDNDSISLLQTIWNFIYGAELLHTVKLNGPVFSIVCILFIPFPTPTVFFHRLTSAYANGGLESGPLPLQLSRHSLKRTMSLIALICVKNLLPTTWSLSGSFMEVLRRKMGRYVFISDSLYIRLNSCYRLSEKIFFTVLSLSKLSLPISIPHAVPRLLHR